MECIDRILAAIDGNDFEYLSGIELDVNCPIEEEDNDTVFLYAVGVPRFTHLDYLLEKRPDIRAVNDYGENILHSAVYSNSLERLDEVFTKVPSAETLINEQSKDGSTPLLLATLLGYDELATYLINKGADVCLPDHELNTPLHFACHHGCLLVVKALIEYGAHPFVKTKKGNYPLACAVNSDKKDVVKYLVQTFYQ